MCGMVAAESFTIKILRFSKFLAWRSYVIFRTAGRWRWRQHLFREVASYRPEDVAVIHVTWNLKSRIFRLDECWFLLENTVDPCEFFRPCSVPESFSESALRNSATLSIFLKKGWSLVARFLHCNKNCATLPVFKEARSQHLYNVILELLLDNTSA
jgi:hypothetical protein